MQNAKNSLCRKQWKSFMRKQGIVLINAENRFYECNKQIWIYNKHDVAPTVAWVVLLVDLLFVLFVHLMYTIFPWVSMVLYIQRIQIFRQIHLICTSNIHTFQLNFHYFVLSTKSNFSTSLDYLYILCRPSRFGTFIDFPSIFPKFLHSTNSNFFTNLNYLRHLPLGDLYESFIFLS